MTRISIILIAIAALLTANIPAIANIPGATATTGIGGRAAVFDEAFVAIADDASAIYWNPAGLASLRDRYSSTLSHNSLFSGLFGLTGIQRDFLSLVHSERYLGIGMSDEQYAEETFTYNPMPTITSISPESGKPNGGTRITITGENFIENILGVEAQLTVTVGGIAAEKLQFDSAQKLYVTTPSHTKSGEVDVIVTNPDSQQAKGTFTYNAELAITSISPESGRLDGGTEIIIKGIGFIEKIPGVKANLTVTIGGAVVEVRFVSSSELTAITPGRNQPGEVEVIVINPDGQQDEEKFTYNPLPTITKISPESGKLAGGTEIIIKGIGFIEQISDQRITVIIGDVPAKNVQFISETQLTAITPARVDVIVINPDGQQDEEKFTYNPFPAITGISPESGKLDGGTTITIIGTGFIQEILGVESKVTVTIGGVVAEMQFVSAIELTALTPERYQPGEVDVIVTNPDGQQTEIKKYTYNPIPTITGISPESGKLAGKTEITITGTGFIKEIPGVEAKLTVTFGNIVAEDVQFTSSTELTTITPGRYQPGEVDVIVTNPDEQYAEGIFTYNAGPVITSISPGSGKLAGGTEIIIDGTGFIEEIPGVEAKLTVMIGGVDVKNMQFVSANQLTAITPERDQPGEVAVIITNPDGQQVEEKYTYNPMPTITSISPKSGKLTGGTEITITGTGFIGQILDEHLNIKFKFGNVDVTANIESILPTQIAITAPASANPKTVDVIITNPDGQITSTKFIYNPFPTVESITPDRGTGGTSVIISGENFIKSIADKHISLKVSDVSVEKIDSVSSKEITFTAPAHEVGSFPIVVINPDGQESQEVINFTYPPVPTITDISPPCGGVNGGTEVTLKGTRFICEIPALGRIQVKIGDEPVEVDGCSPTELRFTTPSNPEPGDVFITVTNPDGQQAQVKFTYTSAPIVRDVTPKIGTPEGDTVITIKGENFLKCIIPKLSLKVDIGGRKAPFVEILSDTEIIARTPRAETPDNIVSVVIIGPDGQRLLEDVTFTYNNILRIINISPEKGSPAGRTEVTVSGTGFTDEIPFNVWFGDIEAKDIQVASPKRLIIRTPPGVPEAVVDVTIENDDRQQFTLKNGFEYTGKLVVIEISPTIGPVKGGTEVVITGTGFIQQIGGQNIEVTFGGKLAVIVSVEPTKLIVKTPPGAPDTAVKVIVTGPDGQKVTPGSRFHYIDFPEDVKVYNYPNPTPVGKGTTFRFRDNNGKSVEIKIFNMAGELVRSLSGNGGNTIPWDGRDRFCNIAPFGLYPYVYLVDGVVKQGQLLHIYRK